MKKTVLFLLMLVCCYPGSAERLTLPPGLYAEDLLAAQYSSGDAGGWNLRAGGAISGSNNVASIWDVNADKMPAHILDEPDAWAKGQYGAWTSLSNGKWIIGYGKGERQVYVGNQDAGQLWIDLHSGGPGAEEYLPQADTRSIAVSWYGLGRSVVIRSHGKEITGGIFLRTIIADDFLSRSIIGQVNGEDFSGMVRTVMSDSTSAYVKGGGWSLDLRLETRLGKGWQASAAVEGLLGEMTWKNLAFSEEYILSPQVFVDSDGFLHDIGGGTGMIWRDNVTLKLDPSYRAEVISLKKPNILLGVSGNMGDKAVPSLGAAWPQKENWAPYSRYYPTEHRLELGAVGQGWQFSIAGDNSPDALQHADINLSVTAVTF